MTVSKLLRALESLLNENEYPRTYEAVVSLLSLLESDFVDEEIWEAYWDKLSLYSHEEGFFRIPDYEQLKENNNVIMDYSLSSFVLEAGQNRSGD